MRREDDARALELLRLRNENALLKHKYDALFHERLIKSLEASLTLRQRVPKAQSLSSNANANANANANVNANANANANATSFEWRVSTSGLSFTRGFGARRLHWRVRRRSQSPAAIHLLTRVPEGDRGQESDVESPRPRTASVATRGSGRRRGE